jgi:methanogenic corrinoid protein MtbC1
MNIVGIKFKNNEVFVPEVLIAARAMKAGTDILKPYLVSDNISAKGKVVLGTVRGDFHDIGKNLVKMMMEGHGLEVIDLGVDVAPEAFINAAKENGADIIACSALLTTTMAEMKNVVDLCTAEGIRDNVKVLIGGAPITEAFKNEIGADIYTSDAASAAEAAAALFA